MRSEYTIDPFYKTLEWRMLRGRTLSRDRFTCQYCGNKAQQADHVIPRKRGGHDVMSNLVACCHRCNELLGNKTFPSFDEKKKWLIKTLGYPKKHTITINRTPSDPTENNKRCVQKTCKRKQCKNDAAPGSTRCAFHTNLNKKRYQESKLQKSQS